MNISKFCFSAAAVSVALLASSSQIASSRAEISFPATPSNCRALHEISTGDTVLRKTIKFGDQNTDFAVPTGKSFRYYIARMIPENNAKYTVAVNLKYNTGNHATVFSKTAYFNRLQLYKLKVQSPVAKQPYQVNFDINGPVNNVYDISVLACN